MLDLLQALSVIIVDKEITFSLLKFGSCLSLFSVAVTQYLRLANLWGWGRAYSAHSSKERVVQD